MVDDELFAVLTGLADAKVRFLVVGGVAVVLLGYPRMTADLDLVLDLASDNASAALDVFARIGFRPRPPVPLRDFADPAIRRSWIDEKGLTVFSLWSPDAPGTEVDLFVEEPFDFASAYARAEFVQLEGRQVPVVSLEDLIELKQKAGRAKDLEDVTQLQGVLRRREGKS